MNQNKKGNLQIALIGVVVVLVVLAGVSLAKTNGNGLVNIVYEDVDSNTPVAPQCQPKKYLVELHGTLDLINDYYREGWSFGEYEITYIDSHINDISFKPLGIFSNDFDAELCLYDVLHDQRLTESNKIECIKVKGDVTKGRIEKFPFTFRYNLWDNNCDGQVDDHTLYLQASIKTEDGFTREGKTIGIIGGELVYSNAKY